MKPLVTIIVPTLNRTTYLAEALNSVLAQDYPNLDILVSDNGSRDDTPDVARAIAGDDPRVRFPRNEKTVPLYQHFNQFVTQARGEFYMVVCDDDVINPACVSELIGVVERHPEINVVIPANVTIDEKGTVLTRFAHPDGEKLDSFEYLKHWLYEGTPLFRVSGDDVDAHRHGEALRRLSAPGARPEHRQPVDDSVRADRAGRLRGERDLLLAHLQPQLRLGQ